jgi:hypothetical protein
VRVHMCVCVCARARACARMLSLILSQILG